MALLVIYNLLTCYWFFAVIRANVPARGIQELFIWLWITANILIILARKILSEVRIHYTDNKKDIFEESKTV